MGYTSEANHMTQTSKINAKGVEINVLGRASDEEAFISLTDIAKYKDAEDPRIVITNWMSTYATIDFLAVWEELHNPDFNRMEFQSVRSEPGRLIMTPKKWIELTGAIDITSKSGHNGGTYAHTDIAFEFASWISPEFKLYIIKDYQRLKKDEADRKAIGWDEKRVLSKLNYHIHTEAIQQYLIDEELTPQERNLMFASEGDLLNLALFGKKAWEWRTAHPEEGKKGENIRDYASAEELVVLINLESLNSELIKDGLDHESRYHKLREVAKQQMDILARNHAKKAIGKVYPNLLKGGSTNVD